jgi:two-component system phosphate regulon response regulator OmpR
MTVPNTPMNKHHILIVDDDSRILSLLKQFLSKNGYLVSGASSAFEAQELFEYFVFDLIILDVMMPELTGFEFAEKVKHLQNVPIILLTALSKVEDRIKGLESGADDYLSKPFEPKELLLRMQNLIELYSKQQSNSQLFFFGSNSYNITTKELKKGDDIVQLTSTEQKLLELFIENKNKVLNREDLVKVMGSLSLRSIDVQVVRLRAKIEDNVSKPKYLQTLRNEGYAFYI